MKGINYDQIREDVRERVKKNSEIICKGDVDDRVVGALKRNNSLLMKLRNTLLEEGGLNAYDIKSDGKNPEVAMWRARCERFKQVIVNHFDPLGLCRLAENGCITYNDFAYLKHYTMLEKEPEFLMKNLNIPVKTCIIYSPSELKAKEKLDEIIKQKADRGIAILRSKNGRNGTNTYATFIDDEHWVVITSLHGFKGRKWYKCWIDESTSMGTFRTDIEIHAEHGREDMYFLW